MFIMAPLIIIFKIVFVVARGCSLLFFENHKLIKLGTIRDSTIAVKRCVTTRTKVVHKNVSQGCNLIKRM